MSAFQKAVRQKVFLKLALQGPSGSGKTYSALRLAFGLGGKIAFVDTENGSGSLYAGIGKDGIADYDIMTIEPPFHPKKYITAIQDAVTAGYEVLIIDSFSHAWREILEMKSRIDSQGGNNFTNWAKVKPLSEELKQAVLQARVHVICCMRAKDEYALEQDDKGKQSVKKVGLGPIQEPGVEYEFTTVFDVAMDHAAATSKDRTGLFANEVAKITPEHGSRLLEWLSGGAEPIAKPEPAQPPAAQSNGHAPSSDPPTATAKQFMDLAISLGYGEQVKKANVQAFLWEIAPDYQGRPYSVYTGRDWAFMVDAVKRDPFAEEPAAPTEETDPFEDGNDVNPADLPPTRPKKRASEAAAATA